MNDNDLIRRGDALKLVYAEPDWGVGTGENLLRVADGIRAIPAVPVDALTLERAAGPYLRTGVFDKDGREICVGDKIRIDLTSKITKPEYWRPEYEVIFQPPHFTLKHIGGNKDSDTARFYFSGPQPGSREKIETIRTATAPEPAEVTAARVLLDAQKDAQKAAMANSGKDMTFLEEMLLNLPPYALRAIVEGK